MVNVYVPFVDWMKCLGIALIVFGHVVASPLNAMTPPIYPKQLGVAFFMFISGYTLALDRRPPWRVVLNRLFEVVLVGLLCAVTISAIRLTLGLRPDPSNYLPFFFGANVLFNNFPANPTTWYIGTYIHVLLAWAVLLRRVRVRPALLLAVLTVEIAMRTFLWTSAGEYVAYMLLTNWLSVFLLGQYCGQHVSEDSHWRPSWVWQGLVVALVVWIVVAPVLWPFDNRFPFRGVSRGAEWWPMSLSAVGVSSWYLGATWLTYRVTSLLPRLAIVRFIAINTVVIFVTHMPLLYLALPVLDGWRRVERSAVLFVICLFGLAVAGGIFRRVVRPTDLRERMARWLAFA